MDSGNGRPPSDPGDARESSPNRRAAGPTRRPTAPRRPAIGGPIWKLGAIVTVVAVLIVVVVIVIQWLVKDSPPTDDIKRFDFANATVAFTDPAGTGRDYRLVDGHAGVDGFKNTEVGLHLIGEPHFADVDSDSDLDAVTVMKWLPSAGAELSYAYIWLWDGKTAWQSRYPINAGDHGAISGLKAVDGGFRATIDVFSAWGAEGKHEDETITIGVKSGYPVQTAPVFGAVDRCVRFDDAPPGGRADGTVPLVAPRDGAPAIGEAGDFTQIFGANTELRVEGWALVAAIRSDGGTSCGWVHEDEIHQ